MPPLTLPHTHTTQNTQQDDDDAPQPMDPAERAELLSHLKSKWAAVNAQYLKLGFVLDIESKASNAVKHTRC